MRVTEMGRCDAGWGGLYLEQDRIGALREAGGGVRWARRGPGSGSRLRASEGWKRGPSAGKGILGGNGELRPRDELERCGCVWRR